MSVVENAINDAVDYFMENPSNAFPSGLPSQTDVRLVLNDLVGEEGYGRASQSASVKKVMALLKKHSKNLLMENMKRRKTRCWKGYKPVKGKRPYSKGSCRRIKKNARRKPRASDLARWRAEAKVRDDKSRGVFWTSTKDYMSGPKYDPARWDSRGVPINTPDWYRASLKSNRRRGLRRNEEYARQIPRRDRPMRGRGFDKKFDVSAGSDYRDLEKLLLESRNKENKKIGANTYVIRYGDGSIGVVLYQTRILRYYPNGDVDVNFGGYMTPTTFSRINSLIPYGWNLRKKAGKLALENSWGQRAVIRKPRAGEEYSVRLTSDKAYLID